MQDVIRFLRIRNLFYNDPINKMQIIYKHDKESIRNLYIMPVHV